MSRYGRVQQGMKRLVVPVLGLTLILSATTATAASVTSTTGGIGDNSRALGVAHLCNGVLESLGRNPGAESLIKRIYAAGLQDINAATRYSFGTADVAEAIGIIRGAQVRETGRNPPAAIPLESQAKQCLADLKNPKFNDR